MRLTEREVQWEADQARRVKLRRRRRAWRLDRRSVDRPVRVVSTGGMRIVVRREEEAEPRLAPGEPRQEDEARAQNERRRATERIAPTPHQDRGERGSAEDGKQFRRDRSSEQES